jgi:hypothetical protein
MHRIFLGKLQANSLPKLYFQANFGLFPDYPVI